MSTDTAISPATSVEDLSLEQQAALGSGAAFWTTKTIGSIPAVTMTDGPHGVRRQTAGEDHLGISESHPATCFPPAVGLGQSWNPELVERVSAALGEEAQAAGVRVLLGPGINIKRDPRCGRNFEYLSEDPFLTGVLGAAWVRGLQSRGVGASLKHFAANNTEHDRMRSSSEVDERTLREIYLRGFERVVREAQPWTVMCSYNRVNGVHAAQHRWLLTEVLRGEWGFDGAVISDWGAVVERVASVAAGLDLQMPGPAQEADQAVVAAVEAGALDPAEVTRAAQKVAALAYRAAADQRHDTVVDTEEHHALAREAAAAGVVLLKNDGAVLPLRPAGSIAVVGQFAATPRYQGGGSSHVNPTRLDVPLEEIRAMAGTARVSFAPGFTTDGSGEAQALRQEAVATAGEADTAVVFLGLSSRQESEGFDREHIELPAEQLTLLAAVLEVQPRTVVVLSHGGVLRLSSGVVQAPAVLDAALLGQAAGGAVADVLFGTVNPSGRLTETVPVRIQDVPSYLSFPGQHSRVRYAEGLFVGYRWYDARAVDVSFPFGHGLSYTTFDYSDLEVDADDAGLTVRVTVTNTGNRAGREVVQVYTSLPGSGVERAPRELKGFGSLTLAPGHSGQITLRVRREDLAYWDSRLSAWLVEGGDYAVHVGASSRDLRLSQWITVPGDDCRIPLTLESTFAEVLAHPIAGPLLGQRLGGLTPGAEAGSALGMDMTRMMASIPIGRFAAPGGQVNTDDLAALLAHANTAHQQPPTD